MTKYIRNEKGAASFVMLGIFVGLVIMGFLFFDMTSVFMERRMSQTNSDSAALAAALKAEELYEEYMKTEAEEYLDELKARTDAHMSDWEANKDEDDTRTWEEVFMEWIESLEAEFGRSMPGQIVSFLRSGGSVDINVAMKFLWDPDEVSDMICGEVDRKREELREEAEEFAVRNGMEEDNEISLVFPVEGDEFKIGIRTKGTINDSFLNSVDTDDLKVPAHAVVEIEQPKDFEIVCNNL